jgi:O-antigen/teichoic acid export membrane protein
MFDSEEDIILFLWLLAARPLVTIFKAGFIFLSSIASEAVCNFLGTLSSDVLNLVLGSSSSVCSLSRGVLSNVTVTAYGEVWTKYQTTIGLPSRRGIRYPCPGVGAR